MASINDKITDVRNAARPNSARVSSGRSAGGTILACDNLTGWPTTSKIHLVTYQIDSNSNPVNGTQLDAYGIVSGNNIGSFTVVDGTDNGNSVGDVVEMLPTAAWGQDLADALMASHDRDGTLKDGAVDSAAVLASNVVTSAKILADAVTTIKILDNNVTASKLSASAITLGYSPITTNFTTTNTSATQVTGLTVSVTIPDGGRKVEITAFTNFLANTASANSPIMTVWDGAVGSGTQVAQADFNGGAAGDGGSAIAMAILTPSAGAKTYNVGLHVTTSGTAQLSGQATSPAFILVKAI